MEDRGLRDRFRGIAFVRPIGALALVAAACLLFAGAAFARSIDEYLGPAGPWRTGAPWSMISLGNFTANGPGVDDGNVAVASGSATINNPFSINGELLLGAGVSYSSNITPTGGVSTVEPLVSEAAAAARRAASEFGALAPTQTVGPLGNNSTITGTEGLNVIDTSAATITNGTLTVEGGPNSVFVVNISGEFSVSNGGVVLAGGVQAGNVLWDIAGNLTITGGGGGGATFYGIALDVNGNVTVHDDTWNGEIIGATITDTSGFRDNAPPAEEEEEFENELEAKTTPAPVPPTVPDLAVADEVLLNSPALHSTKALEANEQKLLCKLSQAPIHGASASKRDPFSVRTSALGTKQANFYLDGQKIKTLDASQAKDGEFVVRINPRKLSYGTHRIKITTVETNTACAPIARSAMFMHPEPITVKHKFTG